MAAMTAGPYHGCLVAQLFLETGTLRAMSSIALVVPSVRLTVFAHTGLVVFSRSLSYGV